MANLERFGCQFCGRINFASQNALDQHQRHGLCAIAKDGMTNGHESPPSPMSMASQRDDAGPPPPDDDDTMAFIPPPSPPRKPRAVRIEIERIEAREIDAVTRQISGILAANDFDSLSEHSYESDDFSAESGQNNGRVGSDSSLSGDEYASDDQESNASGYNDQGPDTTIRDQFQEYCAYAQRNFLQLTDAEQNTIKLLHTLKEKNAPMNAFEPVMLWHLKSSGKLRDHQRLGDYPKFIGRKAIMKTLQERYNFGNKMPFQKTVKLPVSGSIVKLTCHDAKATIQRLLTDPRIQPQDYLFWDGNPLAGPPENLDYVKDLNTGQAYLQTHAKLITKQGQQLLPIIIYSDGTAVSHFHDMEIIQVNIALGIMTREARLKPHCWAPLGYVEKVHEQGGRGRSILEESQHVDTQDAPLADDDSAQIHEADGVGDKNDQDFHAMMEVILEDFVELQNHGLLWDFYDRRTGIRTNNIQYLPFVPFLRVDGKEADLCCAKYAQRSSTQQICRKCHVPLEEADNHLAKYKFKTVKEIKNLVEKADLDGLKALSQQYLKNALYDVRFSLGNDQGIHGSCPSELLHAFLLGTFKYIRDIFFEMIGSTSEGSRQINALSQLYAKFFSRQSDRTMPGTAFSRGIQAGKLMAKDYRGVLLIILAIVRSTKGRDILKRNKNFKSKHDTALDDWILLVELMLEWESYLNEPLMYVKHVKRLEKKHRYIMYIMRKVAQRTKGMGLKLLKFHTILHIWEDILAFGVPLEFDTSANESMHKPSKKASKMTQRAADTFNFQTATRLCEFALLDLAMAEIEHGLCMWHYFRTLDPDSSSSLDSDSAQLPTISTGETKIRVFREKDGVSCFQVLSRSKQANSQKTQWTPQLIDFLLELQDLVEMFDGQKTLPIYTCHRRDGQIFRGHPNFRGKGPWRDWVWVDWGPGYGSLPCHIWCFVVLEGIPKGKNTPEYGGIPLKDGTYAVVETTNLEENDQEIGRSDLMMPVLKDIEFDHDGYVAERTFYLADTEAFTDPCCTVPDIGGPPNRYFVVKPRNQWSQEFIKWVQDPHELDKMDLLDVVEEDNKVMDNLEEDRPRRGKD